MKNVFKDIFFLLRIYTQLKCNGICIKIRGRLLLILTIENKFNIYEKKKLINYLNI